MYVEAGKAAVEFAWKHRRELGEAARQLREIAKSRRIPRVAVFGSGGVGKSTVGKFLESRLTEEELLRGYRDSFAIERFGLPDRLFGRLLVAPGQRTRTHARDELSAMVRDGRIGGIINVVAYGYHAFPSGVSSYREDRSFHEGMDKRSFLDAYLIARQAEEIAQLRELEHDLAQAPKPIWLMTLVTKQDLWWDRRKAVRAHYENGEYAEVVRAILMAERSAAFQHDLVSVALTWENLMDGTHEVVATTVAGYDQKVRLANLSRFGLGVRQLAEAMR